MFLLAVKKKFIVEHTLIGTVLTGIVALVYHLFIPERYFLWFPAIPIFFYLFGLLYIGMFTFSLRMGAGKVAMTYMVCKTLKFILSAFVMIFYGFVIKYEFIAFVCTFVFFYFAFLIFETRFFLLFEEKLKQEKMNNEKTSVHSNNSTSAD